MRAISFCLLMAVTLPPCLGGEKEEQVNPAMLVPPPSASEYVPPPPDQSRPELDWTPKPPPPPLTEAQMVDAMTKACTPDGACDMSVVPDLLINAPNAAVQKKMQVICQNARKLSMAKMKAIVDRLDREATVVAKAGYQDDDDCAAKSAVELQRLKPIGDDIDKLADKPQNGRNIRPLYDELTKCAQCTADYQAHCRVMADRLGDAKMDMGMDQTPYCMGPKIMPKKK